ncbi:Retrovirus-related Pol polyprotein from transposon RE1 [Vitis vinifera]|uniref:Retrovirus-related Pol polyprotein from transposon RE1 n=1 Tax=Vitis vinifera TaxID=29760 RepID=A0A438C1U5_VITVI|nr:Retrovirus-related Pol polyprotein from transposon RE1 [Vitis vinifera]
MQKAPEEVHIEQEAPKRHILNKKPLKIHILNEKPLKRHSGLDIIRNDEDPEPRNVEECRHRNDWPKWKEAIQAELNSLTKREVFGPVVQTPEDVKPVGYKWVFVRKRNENNEIIRYKARLVAQGFSQRPGIDYEETYSPVMDAITFRFLISLAVSEGLDMRLMDVITAYLYGSMDNDIYMKIPEGFKLPDANNTKPRSMYSIKLQRSLYGLKQSGRMWYNRLSEYLLKEGYVNNPICPCISLRNQKPDLQLLQYPFRPCEKDEELLGPEVPYLSAIGALMYLANCTRPDIAFSVNLLARYSSAPTRRHWNGIKHILRYLRGTTDMGLFYSRESKQQLLGYADAGYLSDPHKGRSQTGYVFNCNGTAISWRSVKQTMVATSSNHSEILAIHEASRECIWLRSMIQHIRESCGLSSIKGFVLLGFTGKELINASKTGSNSATVSISLNRNFMTQVGRPERHGTESAENDSKREKGYSMALSGKMAEAVRWTVGPELYGTVRSFHAGTSSLEEGLNIEQCCIFHGGLSKLDIKSIPYCGRPSFHWIIITLVAPAKGIRTGCPDAPSDGFVSHGEKEIYKSVGLLLGIKRLPGDPPFLLHAKAYISSFRGTVPLIYGEEIFSVVMMTIGVSRSTIILRMAVRDHGDGMWAMAACCDCVLSGCLRSVSVFTLPWIGEVETSFAFP